MIQIFSNPLKKCIKNLVSYYERKNFHLILSQEHELIKTYPNSFLIYKLLGSSYLELKLFDKAISNFLKATQINPNDHECYFNLGLSFQYDGKLDQALKFYKKLIHLIPEHVEAYSNIGIIFRQKNEFDNSLFFLKRAISLSPKSADLYNNIAVIYMEIGEDDLAEKNYELAIKINPNHLEAICNLANLQRSIGKLNSSLKNSKKAIYIDPKCEEAYFNLGMIQKDIGDFNSAKKNFEKVVELQPFHHSALHMINSIDGNNKISPSKYYISKLFDSYANKFDNSLIYKLSYNLPKKIADLVNSMPNESNNSILDLGCGTGLVGRELQESFNFIVGVDISEKMIDKAKKLKIYNKLVNYEIIDYLNSRPLCFDLFIAADVLVYIGDLTKIFKLIKSRNKQKGTFIFSTEHLDGNNFRLEKSGRFSHSFNYIKKLSSKFSFDLIFFEKLKLRKENGKYIIGGLYMLEF